MDIMTKTDAGEKIEFKAEMKQLLHLIIHSLYTHPEVFLRELISNSSDAMNKVRIMKLKGETVLDPDAKLEIRIDFDEKEKTFSIEDSGLGMTRENLIEHLGTIAKSGTMEYVKQLTKSGGKADEGLIGQFGVGFYSVFIVTDKVVVETRHAGKDSKGLRWTSTGESAYTIEEIDKKTRGTKISFTLKEDATQFAQEHSVNDVIGKYSNFADFPIMVKDKQANQVEALWRKNAKDITKEQYNEFYKFIASDALEPATQLAVAVEGASVSFKSLLFIPNHAPQDLFRLQQEGGVHLYCNKILIKRECADILPPYLRFIRGVVDTEDIPLNVSREMIQASPVTNKIKDILTKKVLAYLNDWSQKEPKAFQEFIKRFGPLLKSGLDQDFINRDAIIQLLRFQTTKTKVDEYASLKEYVARMKPSQDAIYYLAGESRAGVEANPNLEYFKKQDMEVLILCDPVDIFIVPSINEFEKKPLKSADKADIDLAAEDKIEKPEDKLGDALIQIFKTQLKDKVEDVKLSKRLVDSAATLVRGDSGMDAQMEKMMRMMNQDVPQSKRILEVNLDHPVLKNLAKLHLGNVQGDLIAKCISQIYDNALLADGDYTNIALPELVKRMNELMQSATQDA
ncbi:MAG: molecular chaperone HtpG [Candidatus Omnitrophota bacterium]|jgi:molecular chaperone HtpG